jgi:hypothetical protein
MIDLPKLALKVLNELGYFKPKVKSTTTPDFLNMILQSTPDLSAMPNSFMTS